MMMMMTQEASNRKFSSSSLSSSSNQHPQAKFSSRINEIEDDNNTRTTKTDRGSGGDDGGGGLVVVTPVILCILVTETGERFAYYGFRAILVLYFTAELGYDENQAIALFAYTTALAYLAPILGALLADGGWGRYATILRFGIIYIMGLFLLTIAAAKAAAGSGDHSSSGNEVVDQSSPLFVKRSLTMVGLFLVCLGTGGIKPCVSAFGADQVGASMKATKPKKNTVTAMQEETDAFVPMMEEPSDGNHNKEATEATREKQVMVFFSYFYFCINLGAVTSIAIIPIIRGKWGFGVAFLLPTIFMVTAMALFISMRRQYIHHIPGKDGSTLSKTFLLWFWLLRRDVWVTVPAWIRQKARWMYPGPMPMLNQGSHRQRATVPERDHDSNHEEGSSVDSNENHVLQEQCDDAAQALHVLPILAMLPVFWCLYDQQSSVWTLQATRMELNGLQPEQLNIVNPLQILIFVPLFDRCIYPLMSKYQFNIRPLRRMSYGMLLAALAFFISGYVEAAIQAHESNDQPPVNVFWQLPQITLLSVAEIFVSVTGLEFAYASSPDRLKAFIMALFLLTTAIGDFMSGILYSTVFTGLNRSVVMHICGILMVINLIAFVRLSYWWEKRDSQKRSASSAPCEGVELNRGGTEGDWVPTCV